MILSLFLYTSIILYIEQSYYVKMQCKQPIRKSQLGTIFMVHRGVLVEIFDLSYFAKCADILTDNIKKQFVVKT